MKSHIFITKKYLDVCLETGLFGVTDSQMNYLSNVDNDDLAFILETQTGRLVGPFIILEPLFYNETNIWGNHDTFYNKVKICSERIYESDISALWKLLLQRESGNFFSFTTYQRSSNTLFPGEGETLAHLLEENGKIIHPPLTNNLQTQNVNYIKNDRRRFSSEARLESVLIKNKNSVIELLHREGILSADDHNFIINQITLPGVNYNVDIAIINENRTVLIEIKKDEITTSTLSQLLRYKKYWENTIKIVKMVAIGASFERNNPEILQIKYEISDNQNSIHLVTESEHNVEIHQPEA